MSDRSLNAHVKKGRVFPEFVYFAGTTALVKGQGLCWNWDYGTAADVDYRRDNYVEVPSITNSRHFAGVTARAYTAKSTGQWVEIYGPGSCCEIALYGTPAIVAGSNVVIGCQAGGTYAGYFTRIGFEGEGSAVPLQTVDASAPEVLYCQAKLQIGKPSGLVEVVTLDTDGGAVTLMAGGISYFPASALDTADATFTMADGTAEQQRKKWYIEGDLADAFDLVITVNGIQRDGADTALATLTGDDDGDVAVLEWNCQKWVEVLVVGFVIA